jgi:hypothetical protein
MFCRPWFAGVGGPREKRFFAAAVERSEVGRVGPLPDPLFAPGPHFSHGARDSLPPHRAATAVPTRRAPISFLRLNAVHAQNHSVFTFVMPRSRN